MTVTANKITITTGNQTSGFVQPSTSTACPVNCVFPWYSVVPATHCPHCGRCLGCGAPNYPQPAPWRPATPYPYRGPYYTGDPPYYPGPTVIC